MEIICKSCGKKISIPDEKIPHGKTFSIACPQCKNKITVEQEGASISASDTESAAIPAPDASFNIPEDETIDFSEEGQKTALLCDENNKEVIKSVLSELDYKVSIASSSDDAINRMRFTLYDVIILNEEFDNSTPENNKVLKHIQQMAMPTRRRIFFTLTGKNLRTLDNMTAFVKSANLVANIKDLSNLKSIIKKSAADNERFYKVFKEVLKAAGKMN